MGLLIKKIQQQVNGVYITKECNQDTIKEKYSGPQITNFYGYCLAATGKWLVDPEDTEQKITKTSFQTVTMNLQYKFEASGVPGDIFLKNEYPEKLGNPITKDIYKLTPEKLFNEIIYKDATPLTLGYMMIIVGQQPGSHEPSHALGVRIEGGKYKFFDANEGFCEMYDRDTFWQFINLYVTEPKNQEINFQGGLRGQEFTHFRVVLYNHQP